jgi:hypothetical protein
MHLLPNSDVLNPPRTSALQFINITVATIERV